MHWIVAHGREDVGLISDDLNLNKDWIDTYEDMRQEDDEEPADPILLSLDSPNITSDLRGWRVQKALELERPGKAAVVVTPTFARQRNQTHIT